MLAIEAPKVETGPPNWLQDDEDAALLDAQLAPSEESIVWLLRWTALRLGEALTLRWSHIDYVNDSITVECGKGGKARQVPLVPELIPRLRAWARWLEERSRYDTRGYVFVTRYGTPWSQQHAELLVRRAGVRAGLREPLNPHKLRRTYGSHLLNRGARIETVSAVLGHSSVGTTQRYYAALLPETVRAEVLAVLAGVGS
jgi:integrase/recombinase XerC